MADVSPEQIELPKQQPEGTNDSEQLQTPNATVDDNDEDIDDLFESDAEIVPELISADGSDYTKAYNRQRKLNDNSIPVDNKPKTNPQKPSANTSAAIDDQVASLAKHASKIRLTDKFSGATGGAARDKDKADRATTEQVLDRRTQMILLQLINRNIISEIHGVISTGKEANVYHAISETEDEQQTQIHRAVKVYKTSILVFKDRAKYVEGEFRFRQGYNKSNNRAMVRLWADKERRNLARIHDAGIPSPAPVALRNHVLVMGFVGDRKGKAAPRLKDVRFEGLTNEEEDAKWKDLYVEMLIYMRVLYQTCRLIHADLSEYNVLYHEGKQWIIDVSQAVEHDHPRSLEFLRMDIKNVSDFFQSRNVETLSERRAFAFVTSEEGAKDIKEQAQIEANIRTLLETAPRTEEEKQKEDENDEVFRNQYIPQTLDQVYDIERDAELVNAGEGSSLPYQALLAGKVVRPNESDASNPDADSEAGDSDSSEVDQSIFDKGPSRGKKNMNKDEKLAHKKAIKEEKREKRKDKMPKHMKKKLVSQSSRKK
ncbi:Serine/threonine-protein kinase Rio1 [Setomelanomma holmii]|uniref:Serine/threonine-protein kinase RIO1 n=1 Tax=Setomelanomma holmii TaxID=210430 RepID=A0A9P4HEI1_9PLEO|nr:Serine/threonine-protein kinase Rio1 [Setomelanomma holmii]